MSFFKNLFKEAGVKDVVTLFHAPKVPASSRVYTLLKQANATAVANATEDQASDHSTQSKLERTEFELDIQEGAPTSDQLSSILEYLGPSKAGSVIEGATGTTDALRKFKQNEGSFQRPVTVDWNNGRAVVGEDQSEIMKLVRSIPKEKA
ncbi:Putative redox protein fmp46, mitochondrial [Fulvia fulva]|uniref:Redox protein fmp46, mitochondrial n=1 Tax=Passalora fulva TaxID=5499 RepID=A0A9Q8L5E1_PASFU|nr:Putative redox protein fmp46, mitochondrial [Fulvia fulva]KAK4635752.1 putative redox protein fmp46, mitochondrial [Fulvia fulva]KAK4638679.1 putative redox protein fmp46, mitochondrial [Fulvia fulva]UJO11181.1 Putative redox protein fmp46, mitochondrial [Fulvia fulva]WPV09129.1 Putative redox protein fmp46, mitochondrial [Fulvia fulva]WPV24225.1 Putative redox protein fmp46, mitochondrial [Fulvia fulva]